MIAIDDKTRSAAMFVSSVLFRAFILGIGLLVLGGISGLLLVDQIYPVISNLFDMPLPEFRAILISASFLMRTLLFTLFLVPAIAIRWALKEAK